MLKIPCSNCLQPLHLNLNTGTISITVPASGRGATRTPARTITHPVIDEGALYAWEAPCCDDYWDSLDKEAVPHSDHW